MKNNIIHLPNGAYRLNNYSFLKTNSLSTEQPNISKALDLIDYFFSRFLSVIPNPDTRLRNLGMSVYDKTLADPIVTGATETILQSVNALDFEIIINENPDNEIELMQSIIENLFEQDFIDSLLKGIYYGNNYIELIWNKEDNFIIPTLINQQPHECFFYKRNQITKQNELFMYTQTNNLNGELVPKYKVLVPTFRATALNPYGKGLLSQCYKPVFIKNNVWDFWNIFVEDHGIPKLDVDISMSLADTLKSKMSKDYQQILDDIQDDVKELRQNGVFTHYEGLKVNPLISGNKDSSDIHQALMDYCDKQISILLLGHNGSSQSTAGQLGNDNTALTVLDSRVKAYSFFVSDYCNVLLKWIHELNFGTGKAPQVKLYEKEDVSSYKSKAEVDAIIFNMLDLTNDYYSERYNIDNKFIIGKKSQALPMVEEIKEEKPEEKKEKKSKEPEEANNKLKNSILKQFALESTEKALVKTEIDKANKFLQEYYKAQEDKVSQKTIDKIALTEELTTKIEESEEYIKITQENLKPILKYINSCDSYEEMLIGINDLFPNINIDDFCDLLTRMMNVANVVGYN
jgi:phage gp29-like protein